MAASMTIISEIQQQLRTLSDAKIAEHSLRFFKTGEGEYGHGDKFHGIRVPPLRKMVKTLPVLELDDIRILLYDEFHETRLVAAIALVKRYEKTKDAATKQSVVDFYLEHAEQFNNWDLVDSSCHKILGPHLLSLDKHLLFELASSDNLWRRRIAMITTYHFIKRGHFDTTLELANKLLDDKEDLIHKAVGWMLREVGNMEFEVAKTYVIKHCHKMPRTALRYAIEKYPKSLRQQILKGDF